MQALRRTRVGAFSIGQSVSLTQVEEAVKEGRLGDLVLSMEEVLSQYPRVRCRSEEDRLLVNGNPLKEAPIDETDLSGAELAFTQEKNPNARPGGKYLSGRVRMCTSKGDFIGIYEWNADRKRYMPVKMLWSQTVI